MTTPATKDPWALVGFAVPSVLALLFGLWGMLDASAVSSGYQGILFIFWMVAWGPGVLLWLLAGWIFAASTGAPKESVRRFAAGAGVGLGASWIILAATCFGSYA